MSYFGSVTVKDDGGNRASVDPYGGQVLIDMLHHEVHEGGAFSASFMQSVLAGNNLDVLIVTGANELHLRFRVAILKKPMHVHLYEDTTVSANGTSVPIYNANRTSSTTSTTSVYYGPSVTGVGTELELVYLPKEDMLGVTPLPEWILKPNSIYMLRVENASGNDADIGIALTWYEE